MRKRQKTSLDTAIVDVWDRELGNLSTRKYAHRFAASEDLVLRLDILRKLEKHTGCVNTLSFSSDGDILVSGSDDQRVIFWSWEFGTIKLAFHSGHSNNVFQAKIMPYTDDRKIVTCGADGQVRLADVLERGNVETKLLGEHYGRAHKLAIEPGSPHIFYTCGEDGMVQHFDLRTGAATQLFTCQSQPSSSFTPTVHLNAIAIDPRNPNLFAVAGSDEYTRLYDIRKYKWDASTTYGQPADFFCPPHLISDEHVGITGLAFSDQSELLVSYNEELIYLFTRDMGLGPNHVPAYPPTQSDTTTSEEDSEVGPNPAPASPASVQNEASPEKSDDQSSCASDMDDDSKSEVLKGGPQAYKGHRNSETVKGVNFFGPNCEYVVSGSDCGRIFIWKKKGGELIRVMEADKYVVNCIESHPHTTALASSGIEHDVKVWTPIAKHKAILSKSIEQVLKFPLGGFFDRDGDYIFNESDSSDSNDEDDDGGEDDDSDEDEDGDDDDDGDEDEDGDDDDDLGGGGSDGDGGGGVGDGDGDGVSLDEDTNTFTYSDEEEDDDLYDAFSCPNHDDSD